MDRHKIQTNRHKAKVEYLSGSAKRKIAEEKDKKNEELIAKSRRMTDYVMIEQKKTSSAASANNGGLDDTRPRPSTSHGQIETFEAYQVVG